MKALTEDRSGSREIPVSRQAQSHVMGTPVTIHVKKVPIALAFIVILFFILHVIGQLFALTVGHENLSHLQERLIWAFDISRELNLPTYFSSILLLFSSGLLSSISWIKFIEKEKFSTIFSWGFLAFLFLFLSIDELIGLHERLINPVKDNLGVSGALLFAWVIPYGVLIVILAFSYLKFMKRLPRTVRNLFFLAAGLFVFGALGLEMVEGQFVTIHAESGAPVYYKETVPYIVLVSIEELLEMTGVVVFIYALLLYIAGEWQELRLRAVGFQRPPVSA